MRDSRWFASLVLVVGACGGDEAIRPDACVGPSCFDADAARLDAAPDAAGVDARPLEYPATLQATGLCDDPGCAAINAGIVEYAPRWALWSDTASKRRWISLPAGTQIDTSDMDYWRYPEGTQLWKEFTRDGVRVETRYLVKTGAADADWTMVSYVWNATQDATTPSEFGAPNANGTAHDVPSRNQCRLCHEGLPGRVLGFTALQLDYDAGAGLFDLEDAIAAGWLSAPPAAGTPRFPLPGDAVEQAALGYLHANCGHCHNPESYVQDNTPMKLRLQVGLLATVEDTPAYTTTVGVVGMGGQTIITPGDPAQSRLYNKFTSMNPATRMPPLGTEDIDPTGQAAISAWITQLTP
ncbi:MAG: hypothetical protein R2939_13055 [Kofleriaceae bacterium]